MLHFTVQFIREIRKLSTASTNERCALVFRLSGVSVKVCELNNVSSTPQRSFAISNREAGFVLDKFGRDKFLAVVHTHLHVDEDSPSTHDMKSLGRLRDTWPSLVGIVYNVPLGLLVEFSPDGPMRKLLIPSKES